MVGGGEASVLPSVGRFVMEAVVVSVVGVWEGEAAESSEQSMPGCCESLTFRVRMWMVRSWNKMLVP